MKDSDKVLKWIVAGIIILILSMGIVGYYGHKEQKNNPSYYEH